MEASALPASVGLARPRLAFGASLLRLRSDDQLVTLFRAGSEDAFRVIHDRYRSRLHAYTRQMLAGSAHDSEDALQEIFVRAYYGLRASPRGLTLRPWLYRVAHNRCIDELRRQPLILIDPVQARCSDQHDPATQAEQRDALRRLIADVGRLPEQQRSALLMRELSGMAYADVADALGVSVPAVKSLLVRARVGLAQASEARDAACADIREDLILAHDRGVRASGLARRHLSECAGCREFRREMRGLSRQLAGLVPTLGPVGVIANLLGLGGGGSAAAGGIAGGTAGGIAGTGAAASAGLFAGGAGHVVTLLAAAVVTAGGAVELQKTIIAPPARHAHHQAGVTRSDRIDNARRSGPSAAASGSAAVTPAAFGAPPAAGLPGASDRTVRGATGQSLSAGRARHVSQSVPLSQLLDPDHLLYGHHTLATGSGTVPAAPGTTVPGAASGPGAGPAPGSSPTVPGNTAPGTAPAAPIGAGTTNPGTASSTPGSPAPTSTTGSGTGTPTGPVTSGAEPGSSAAGAAPAGQTPAGAPSSPGAAPTKTSSGVARTVAAGSASGRVLTFVSTKRHARHGFALGTLIAR